MQQLGDYQLGRVLGEGSFGDVRLGKHVKTGGQVAVKMMNKKYMAEGKLQESRVALEIEFLNSLSSHPNICKLLDVIETPENLSFVMEYLDGGDMYDYVVSRSRLSENEAIPLFTQICDAVKACHDINIVHHDLKLENLMISSSNSCNNLKQGPSRNSSNSSIGSSSSAPSVKLIDFGLSLKVHRSLRLSTFSGTEAYCAPEILAGKPYDGRLTDIYSLGVILYIMLTGAYPFSEDLDLQFEQQTSSQYLAALDFPQDVSATAKDLVMGLLDMNPGTRMASMEKILQHAFFEPRATSTSTTMVNEELTSVDNEDDDQVVPRWNSREEEDDVDDDDCEMDWEDEMDQVVPSW